MTNEITQKKAISILIIEGFISVSLQVFIMRQLVPFSGTNITITSMVIGVFLAFLALGYYMGGKPKPNPAKTLQRNMIASGIMTSVFFSYSFMSIYFHFANSFIQNNYIVTFIYLTLFLSPVVYLLGQTMPLLTNFFRSARVSFVTGITLALSTVGSFIGSLGTTLILFTYFGMATTLMIDAVLLALIGLALSDKSKAIFYVLGVAVIVLINYHVGIKHEKDNFIKTNEFANYESLEMPGLEILKINNSVASGLYNKKLPFYYAREMHRIINGLNNDNKRLDILVLGAGGFTISHDDKTNNYTYVDIDPDLQEIAEKHLLHKPVNGEIVIKDARLFLKDADKKWDVVIVDLFTHRANMPWHVSTVEFMELLSNSVKNDGYALFNIISKKGYGDTYSKTMDNTISSSLGFCYKTPVFVKGTDFINLVYACTPKKDASSNKIYVDSKSEVDRDLAASSG